MNRNIQQAKDDFNKSMVWFGMKFGKEFQDHLEKVLFGAAMAALFAKESDNEPG